MAQHDGAILVGLLLWIFVSALSFTLIGVVIWAIITLTNHYAG